jgi:hypothetical protein
VLGAQAPGAQIKPFWLTIYDEGGRVNVRQPFPFGVALGMAHVITELG